MGTSSIIPEKTDKFEGIITFKKETLSDTSFFEYFIKDEFVRINKLSKNRKLLTYKIINMKTGTVSIIKPSKKLYIQKPVAKTNIENAQDLDNVEIEKRDNFKYIGKYKCYQWIVTDKKKKTVITYWMSDCSYDYYYKLISFSSDKFYKYFRQMPKLNGTIPLICEERSLLRTKRMTFSAISIVEKKIKDENFKIPSGYSIFE